MNRYTCDRCGRVAPVECDDDQNVLPEGWCEILAPSPDSRDHPKNRIIYHCVTCDEIIHRFKSEAPVARVAEPGDWTRLALQIATGMPPIIVKGRS